MVCEGMVVGEVSICTIMHEPSISLPGDCSERFDFVFRVPNAERIQRVN